MWGGPLPERSCVHMGGQTHRARIEAYAEPHTEAHADSGFVQQHGFSGPTLR